MMMLCPRCWGRSGARRCDYCDGKGRVPDVRLSANWLLSELVRSNTARRLGIPNDPTPAHLQNLRDLAVHLLQPVRDRWGRLDATSGLRREVNAVLDGASSTSAHSVGWAADIIPAIATAEEIMRWLPGSGLAWDQAIIYPSGRLHLGWRRPGSGTQRRELRRQQGDKYPHWSPT